MIKLYEFLADLEFSYKINNDNTLSLIDLLGADLGKIEEEKYAIDEHLASFLVDRLDQYIYDYYISGIKDTLWHECQYKEDIYPYDEKLISAMKKFKDVFDDDLIQYIEDIIKANIDMSELEEK